MAGRFVWTRDFSCGICLSVRLRIFSLALLVVVGCKNPAVCWAALDAAGQEAAGIAAGIQNESGARLDYNEKTLRLEVRDDLGNLIEEIVPGSVSRTVDAAGQEYRLSFGKDESGRPSVLVRPGPAMQKPLLVQVFGRKAVLSPNASLMATLAGERQVFYEPSICGEVYYIEDYAAAGSKVSRLAAAKREVAVLAKPSHPGGVIPEKAEDDGKDLEGFNQAGDTLKSAVFAVFGLPDKQTTPKAKVYRLKGGASPGAGGPTSSPGSSVSGSAP